MIEICETCARSYDDRERAAGHPRRCRECGTSASRSKRADFATPIQETLGAPSERTLYHSARRKGALQVLVAIIALAGAMGAVAERAAIVRAAPATARLFAAIGLPVNLRGLALTDVQAQLSDADGKPMLTVEGSIVNLRQETMDAPPMRIALRDAEKHEIYVWTAQALTAKLGPGERATFRTRLAAPPQGAHDIIVRFAAAFEPLSPIEAGL